MYKRDKYVVKSNKQIAKLVYEMILEGDTQYITKPGQFINIELNGFLKKKKWVKPPLFFWFKSKKFT